MWKEIPTPSQDPGPASSGCFHPPSLRLHLPPCPSFFTVYSRDSGDPAGLGTQCHVCSYLGAFTLAPPSSWNLLPPDTLPSWHSLEPHQGLCANVASCERPSLATKSTAASNLPLHFPLFTCFCFFKALWLLAWGLPIHFSIICLPH